MTGWTQVSLTVGGGTPAGSSDADCVEVASKAGIQLVEGAPRAGTLTLEQEKSYLEIAGAKREEIDSLNPKSACKVALGRLAEIDKLVAIGKSDPPAACEMVGQVQGEDEGWLGNGSLAVATVDAQLKVREKGGNRFVMDMGTEQKTGASSTDLRIGGRAFRCPQ